jgi:hypothetical protein
MVSAPTEIAYGSARRGLGARPASQFVEFKEPLIGSAAPLRHDLEFEVCSGIAQPVEQAAVNRKVQGSNPCPGANFEFKMDFYVAFRVGLAQPHYNRTTTGA